MEDFTRNIQRKKEKELAELQFVGGDGSTSPQTSGRRQEGGAQRKVPLRQRQEVQALPRDIMLKARFTSASPRLRGEFTTPPRL